MIVVFAGRRIDADGAAPARFPLRHVDRVKHEVEQLLSSQRPAMVVGSAACGADLIVLDAASRLGVRRRIVLPFARKEFRARSVVGCPGGWGDLFDSVVSEAASAGDLVELSFNPKDETAYEQTNRQIFRQAEESAPGPDETFSALLLWDKTSRGVDDVTHAFKKEAARLRYWPVVEIDTR